MTLKWQLHLPSLSLSEAQMPLLRRAESRLYRQVNRLAKNSALCPEPKDAPDVPVPDRNANSLGQVVLCGKISQGSF